jgi:formylglycine-generating enzyme required for sulfatase activity
MHGNVCEWCSDWFEEDYYMNSQRRDPQGPSQGSERVGNRAAGKGFRVVLVLSEGR